MNIRIYLLSMLICCSAVISCEKIQSDSERYLDDFELVEYMTLNGKNVEVIPANQITKDAVQRIVVGHGWETIALYELDEHKNVTGTIEIVQSGTITSGKTYPDCFEITGFGEDYLIQYGLQECRHEKLEFSYDESDNSLSLRASWYVSNGKMVYLSDDIMVCAGPRSIYHDDKVVIYLQVFKKVSNDVLNSWRKTCPNPGLWI